MKAHKVEKPLAAPRKKMKRVYFISSSKPRAAFRVYSINLLLLLFFKFSCLIQILLINYSCFFHIFSRKFKSQNFQNSKRERMSDGGSDEEWEVEALLDHRNVDEDGNKLEETEYRIRWVGFPPGK